MRSYHRFYDYSLSKLLPTLLVWWTNNQSLFFTLSLSFPPPLSFSRLCLRPVAVHVTISELAIGAVMTTTRTAMVLATMTEKVVAVTMIGRLTR